ncbi:MAG: hypothetical protein E4G99_10590 [Anaerolineales bacterium]|nr:MAG: hypothetical protein E4G99_10590 [Anaerolineales bacterium]
MKLETLTYKASKGWSKELPSDLDSDQTLILVFAAPEIMANPKPLLAFGKAFPHAHIIGCSTAGEIHNASVDDESIATAIVQFERTRLQSVSETVEDAQDSYTCGERIGHALERDDLSAVFMLSVGTDVNGTELVNGINSVLPADIPVTGGLAGDGERFEKTWVLHGSKIGERSVAAVGLFGKRLRLGYGSMGGWDIFGPERKITRSKANILYELDGKPALELYKEYLGERAEGLPATALLFPLSLHLEHPEERTVVRTVLAVDEKEQSMIFAGDMPQGTLAQMMKANFDRLIDGAMGAAIQARDSMNGFAPILSIAISCVGRRLVLGSRTEEELEVVVQAMPPGSAQIGFYSYGEISPALSGSCDLHNQTMTLTTISEANT